ncbi:MAG: ABC transporter ATP-binding protein [Brevinematales bacterium]|nr:ABC transporter ATP-binding protein [Brevinematales bacterium]
MMLLEIKNINKIYHSGKVDFQALYDINLSIDKSEFVALAGPSGSGKTTLLNIIGCIDSADSGAVVLDGIDLLGKKPDELAHLRRDYFGFIFQTYNLIPVLTVFENVELPLKLLKKYSDAEIKDMVLGTLKRVGLEGLENRMPAELSGGQQQRVSIARAIIKKPKMILADEPTANLDSKTGEGIVDIMKEMNQEDGVTFVFSTHDKLIMEHAKRLVMLRDGKIVQ